MLLNIEILTKSVHKVKMMSTVFIQKLDQNKQQESLDVI